MRALIIGDQAAVVTEVRELLAATNRSYDQIDAATLAGALDAFSETERDLTLLVLPADPETALPLLSVLRKAAQASIFVVGPTHDAKFVLRVLRLGANQYLDQAELKAELAANLGNVTAAPAETTGKGRVVGVLAAGGGAGGSTLAANLAVVLATWSERAVVVDLRLGTSNQESLLDLKPNHNLADLCRNQHRLDQNMFQQSLTRHASGAHLLAAPNDLEDMAAVTPQGVGQVLRVARSMFPYVIVNLDRVLRPEQLAAVGQLDMLLLLMRLDIASLRTVRLLVNSLNVARFDEDHLILVAGRYGQAKELPLRKVEQALGLDIPYQIPDAPADINLAANKGVPVVQECPRARVSKSIVALATTIRQFQRHRQNGHGKIDSLFGRARLALTGSGGMSAGRN